MLDQSPAVIGRLDEQAAKRVELEALAHPRRRPQRLLVGIGRLPFCDG